MVPASAGPIDASKQLRNAVDIDALMGHVEKFDQFARNNGGNRASGLPGYDRSARYVITKLRGAGYDVTTQKFPFVSFEELEPAELEQVEPEEVTYENGVDFAIMSYSGSGDVTAEVTAVDYKLGEGNTSDSGCEDADFANFPEGRIALIQRGFCTFSEKAANAMEAGAVGVVIFNQGNDPGRVDVIAGNLGPDPDITIPVLGTSYAQGVEWIETIEEDGLTLRMFTSTEKVDRVTKNIFAETSVGNDNNVVMAGGHLDSDPKSPGVNDNGSGSAALLEIALEMAKLDIQPKNTVRFVWWGAEEAGTLGSDFYVGELTEEEAGDIALYMNFDMLASPNFARFIFDGNGSAFPATGAGPEGSGAIERVFQRYFENKGLATAQSELNGRSDYAAFMDADIPIGGLFTGADGQKTESQAALFGGTAGEAYDPCYHLACDDIDNISWRALRQMSDAMAHSIYTFAMSTKSVNGES